MSNVSFLYTEKLRQIQESTSLLSPRENKEIKHPVPLQLDLIYHLYSFTNNCIAGISAVSG